MIETIGDATLYLGDWRDIDLPVGAIVTDPPYGIKLKTSTRNKSPPPSSARSPSRTAYGRNWQPIYGDDKPFDPSPFTGRAEVILWGANHYASRLPNSGGWLIWDKKRGGTAGRGFAGSDAELAWTNLFGTVKVKSIYWDGYRREVEVHQHHHPTQKPIILMEWCISFTKAETIIDPYMGSGSTGVACALAGRKFIGVEIDPAHFDTACRRIEAAQSQRRLAV